MRVVYFYCIMFIEDNMQKYKNGSFEYTKEIKSSEEASKMISTLRKDLGFKEDEFILISLNIIGKTE